MSRPAAGAPAGWEAVIGLEVHAQLSAKTKIFCGCPTDFGAPPNTQVCPVCLGHPGSLPVLNDAVVRLAIRAGLGLHCTVAERSVFARKNYFYPDLPKGYQISQFERPICSEGWLELRLDGGSRRAGIQRAHLEEDAGKTTHDAMTGRSLVDFNRTGVPLLEIVGHPDLRSPAEAMAWLKELHRVLRYLEVCDGNMEQGSFRCDANVSVRRDGDTALGTRTEIKNLNSFRNVGRALDWEIRRQVGVLEGGGALSVETRLFDADRGVTRAMRSKEDSADYRYFPDPDLGVLTIDPAEIEATRAALGPLPADLRRRFAEDHGLRPYDVDVLTDERALAEWFEAAVAAGAPASSASAWVQTELLGRFDGDLRDIAACPVAPEAFARLLVALDAGRVTGKMAKAVFARMWEEGADPDDAIAAMGAVIGDDDALQAIIDAVVEEFPAQVADFRAGKEKILGFLMGQVMRRSKGKADPARASALLRETLRG